MRLALGTGYSTQVRYDARRIDVGVRNVVALLNHITGVTTRASCEGAGSQLGGHVHAALAYVAFRHPMPLQLQDFLVTRFGSLARIENDAIYCRWPIHNRVFLGAFESAARLYLSGSNRGSTRSVRWPLARLRARLAGQVARRHAGEFRLCLTCRELVATAHPESHQSIGLLRLSADLHDRWFAEFLTQPRNALDPRLVASDGWVRLLARTQLGDFGTAFQRRWLRYRAQRVADLTTRHVRDGVEAARRHGVPIDFFYDGTHAVFAWQASSGDGSTNNLSDLEACNDRTRPPEASGERAGSGR